MNSALDDHDLSDTDFPSHSNVSATRSLIKPRIRCSNLSRRTSSNRLEENNDSNFAENGANGAPKPLPSIESFAFRSIKRKADKMVKELSVQNNVVDSVLDGDGDDGDGGRHTPVSGTKRKARRYVVSDDSEGEFEPVRRKSKESSQNGEASMARMIQVKEDDEKQEEKAFPEFDEEKPSHLQEEEKESILENGEKKSLLQIEEKEAEGIGSEPVQIDLIGNTLQKCDEIAATLRKELNIGGSNDSEECYAEVDASAAKIVSQV